MIRHDFILILTMFYIPSVWSGDLPSCSNEVSSFCLGKGADLSPEGINACLQSDPGRLSSSCRDHFKLMAGCAEELSGDGICGNDHANGDGVVCLLQRTAPEKISQSCKDAFPQEEEKTGLAKFWADGKQFLSDEDVASLNEDEQDTYQRWVKRKKSRGRTNTDRDYAIRKEKQSKAEQIIVHKVTQIAKRALSTGKAVKSVRKLVMKNIKQECRSVMKTDKIVSFKKSDFKRLTKRTIKQAQKLIKLDQKAEL